MRPAVAAALQGIPKFHQANQVWSSSAAYTGGSCLTARGLRETKTCQLLFLCADGKCHHLLLPLRCLQLSDIFCQGIPHVNYIWPNGFMLTLPYLPPILCKSALADLSHFLGHNIQISIVHLAWLGEVLSQNLTPQPECYIVGLCIYQNIYI